MNEQTKTKLDAVAAACVAANIPNMGELSATDVGLPPLGVVHEAHSLYALWEALTVEIPYNAGVWIDTDGAAGEAHRALPQWTKTAPESAIQGWLRELLGIIPNVRPDILINPSQTVLDALLEAVQTEIRDG